MRECVSTLISEPLSIDSGPLMRRIPFCIRLRKPFGRRVCFDWCLVLCCICRYLDCVGNCEKVMPVYEYKCPECDGVEEITRSIEYRDTPAICTKDTCYGLLKRIISKPAVSFKGTGFYSTDSKPKRKDD